jgi:hypothetical protein
VLWSALQPPDASLSALVQFRQEVGEAARRLAEAEAAQKQAKPRETATAAAKNSENA